MNKKDLIEKNKILLESKDIEVKRLVWNSIFPNGIKLKLIFLIKKSSTSENIISENTIKDPTYGVVLKVIDTETDTLLYTIDEFPDFDGEYESEILGKYCIDNLFTKLSLTVLGSAYIMRKLMYNIKSLARIEANIELMEDLTWNNAWGSYTHNYKLTNIYLMNTDLIIIYNKECTNEYKNF
jgi:hypothetical protein